MPGGAALTGPTTVSQPVGPVSAAPPDFFQAKKSQPYGWLRVLFRVVRVVVFAAIAFSAVTVQVQAVVGQADAMTGGDFTLA